MNTYIKDFDEVRAALGVGEDELPDARLNLPMFKVQLEEGLDAFFPGLTDIYASLDVKVKAGTATRQERRVYGLIQVYSAYFIASLMSRSLPMYAMKSTTDGKAAEERFNNAYTQAAEDVASQLASLAARLLEALEGLGEIVAPITYAMPFASAGLGVDPITGA